MNEVHSSKNTLEQVTECDSQTRPGNSWRVGQLVSLDDVGIANDSKTDSQSVG